MNQLLVILQDDLWNAYIDTYVMNNSFSAKLRKLADNMQGNKKLPFDRRQLNLHRTFPAICGNKRIVSFCFLVRG